MGRLSEYSSYGSYGTNLTYGTRPNLRVVIWSGTKNPLRVRDDNRKRDRQQSVLSLPGHRFLLTLAP